MGVTLFCCLGQPVDGLFPILRNELPLPVQLAQQILRVGVTCFCRDCEPGQRFYYISVPQKLFAQAIRSILVAMLCSLRQPVDTLFSVMNFHVISQQQLAQRILCIR